VSDKYNYRNQTIDKYLQDLAGRTIAPGGGSAAALTAALGAGLNMMVLNFSMKKDEPELGAQFLMVTRTQQEESLDRLSSLIEEDCVIFAQLMKSLSNDKDSQKEYKEATDVPVNICEECYKSMEITRFLLENGNKNLITDVGCAAHMLKAAFDSARLEVDVNLNYIKDQDYIHKITGKLDEIKEFIYTSEKEIAKEVDSIIKNKEK
jgi:formiminotetrahydrofolate cyclodeaminase